jgi:NAD(P)H-hydrate epimerase
VNAPHLRDEKLVSAETARALDREAAASWGLDPFALVEAAGRTCARLLTELRPGLFAAPFPGKGPRVLAAAGSGNNGADALVMLRALILQGAVPAEAAAALVNKPSPGEEKSPRAWALRALARMGVPILVWGGGGAALRETLGEAALIIDGIAGTGLRRPLEGAAAEMAAALNALGKGFTGEGPEGDGPRPLIVSLDIPSGNFEGWEPGMPILEADLTLGIEPLKELLYRPAARPFAGTIVPVGGIFPPALIRAFPGAERITWPALRDRIPRVPAEAYKYRRGLVEIRAGSAGFPGAARIAARGAQAAGAGLVRLVVDPALYPILAVNAGGIMTLPAGSPADQGGRFSPDAILLGPGWGVSPDRALLLEQAAEAEARGVPLILDADAIALAKGRRFRGNAILTPHAGEFAAYGELDREKVLADPGPFLRELARERGLTILFKSHVLYVADPSGRLGVADGMMPALAAGGTGDLLAGFCAAIAARMRRSAAGFDGYTCAAAAAALLMELAARPPVRRRFTDPLELADLAADIAGEAWL